MVAALRQRRDARFDLAGPSLAGITPRAAPVASPPTELRHSAGGRRD